MQFTFIWSELQTNSKDFLTGNNKGQQRPSEGPERAKMAAPVADAGEFESWLNDRLDSLEVDREVYGAYILGVLQEEETDDEKEDALQGILSAFLVIKHIGMYSSSLSAEPLAALWTWAARSGCANDSRLLIWEYGSQNLNLIKGVGDSWRL